MDRILTLDNGEVAEFDSPSALLHITDPEESVIFHAKSGTFAELVSRSGPEEESKCKSLAAEAFMQRMAARTAPRIASEMVDNGTPHSLLSTVPPKSASSKG